MNLPALLEMSWKPVALYTASLNMVNDDTLWWALVIPDVKSFESDYHYHIELAWTIINYCESNLEASQGPK